MMKAVVGGEIINNKKGMTFLGFFLFIKSWTLNVEFVFLTEI
jgi:hypothetical protein